MPQGRMRCAFDSSDSGDDSDLARNCSRRRKTTRKPNLKSEIESALRVLESLTAALEAASPQTLDISVRRRLPALASLLLRTQCATERLDAEEFGGNDGEENSGPNLKHETVQGKDRQLAKAFNTMSIGDLRPPLPPPRAKPRSLPALPLPIVAPMAELEDVDGEKEEFGTGSSEDDGQVQEEGCATLAHSRSRFLDSSSEEEEEEEGLGCPGCRDGQAAQLAHTGPCGCLGPGPGSDDD